MKVLVTGAAGFIGSNLVHYLTKQRPSWKVTALDLLTYAGNLKNISSLVESGQVRFERLDITDDTVIDELFEREKDPIAVIKWKEIYQDAETVTDICEDVAHVVDGILVKQA